MTSKNYGLNGIAGTVELGKGGPKVKDSSGVIEARNNADDAYAVLRAATPVADNDVATKAWVEKRYGIAVTGQIDGGAPPAAGTPGRIFVCTTAGGAYTLNYLYRDTGSAWEEIVPSEGIVIGITDALTGGSVEFDADHAYIWDLDNTEWDDIGPSAGSDTKKIEARTVDIAHTDGAVNIGLDVPANAKVLRARVYVTQAFDGATPTVKIGDGTDDDRLMTEAENDLETTGLYVVDCQYTYGAATQLVATVTTSGASQGLANVTVEFQNA
jgi:hypothetical protein